MTTADPNDLRKHYDWQKTVLFALAVAGGIYAFADKILTLGKTSASIDKIDRMDAAQAQFGVDMARTKIQVEMMNGGLQELKAAQHDGFQDINLQLRQLNITRRNR